MVKRLLAASLLSLAVAVSTCAGALASGTAAGVQTSGSQTALPPNLPPLDCPPPVTSTVCDALPTPQPCPGCSTTAHAQSPAAAAAAPSMYCSPDVAIVCTVLGATVCRKYQCDTYAGAGAAPATTTRSSSLALYCAPSLQDLQCIVDELLNPCQMRCAGTSTAAGPSVDCNIDLLCTVIGLICRNSCEIAVQSAAFATPTSLPGDPCTRDWGEPVDTICHL